MILKIGMKFKNKGKSRMFTKRSSETKLAGGAGGLTGSSTFETGTISKLIGVGTSVDMFFSSEGEASPSGLYVN